jgi:hypothetical protein
VDGEIAEAFGRAVVALRGRSHHGGQIAVTQRDAKSAGSVVVVVASFIEIPLPAQSRSTHRCAPQRDEFVVSERQCDRKAMNVTGCDVGTSEHPGNADASGSQLAMYGAGSDRQLQRIGAAQSIDDGDDRVPARELQIGDQRIDQHLGQDVGISEMPPTPSSFKQ